MMMTYIRVKPWFSNRMKFVIVQVSRSYRLLVCGIITCFHYNSACTNYVTITLWEGLVRSVRCCLWSPIFVSVCNRRNAEHKFLLCYCITTLGGRHCIVGFEWIEHWWLLGTPMPLETADNAMILSAGQASPWFFLMLTSSMIFTLGFC